MTTYELWMHCQTDAYFAVRLEAGRLTGAVGPLSGRALTQRRDLTCAEFGDVVVCARLETERPQYAVVDEWVED